MLPARGPRGAFAAALALALPAILTLSACGGDEVASRPAHRPISVIYVAGEPTGPWSTRLEGLADGAKLAVAERNGLIGERAASTVVAPILQRDGEVVNAAIGGGRILRDSRTLAVLGAFTAPQTALAVPQLNGGEIAFLQYGSGMTGLLAAEEPGEPDRFEPAGRRYELRAVPGDDAVAARIAKLSALRGAQVVAITTEYRAQLAAEAAQRARAAKKLHDDAVADGDDPVPGTSPALTNPSPEVSDADRLAARIAKAVGGRVVPSGRRPARGTPVIVVTDPTETDPTAAANDALKGVTGAALVVDAADRAIDPAGLGRPSSATTYEIRRTVADASTDDARSIRARERTQFGRDRGDAVVAGYHAARRILDLAAEQPEKTIDRVVYANQLTAAAPGDADLPVDAAGQVGLGAVKLFRLQGGRWAPAS